MLTVYLAALAIGGVLVGMSLLSGGEGDGDLHVDGDAEFEFEHELELEHAGLAIDAWLPLTSMRFWTFFLAFGGLTGTLLSLLTSASVPFVAALAGGFGLVAGIAVTRVIRALRKKEVTGHVEEAEFIGKTGKLLLPVSKESVGRVRIRVKGRDVDLTARTDEGRPFAEKEEVIVYDVQNGTALVTSPKRD